MTNLRADLYHTLAEAFADPPQSLFVGTGRPRFWLYESAYLNRMFGPETFAVAKLYRAAGLEIIGAELPDHISNELAYLEHLARLGGDEILPEEKKFIEDHAGRWMPHLGRALALSGDEVYAPMGQLLADSMEEIARQCGIQNVECGRTSIVHQSSFHIPKLPNISREAQCNLCGFCVQVCSTHALLIRETHNETALILKEAVCIGCGKCERICEAEALTMQPAFNSSSDMITLRQSSRVECRGCGEPMVSQAEFDFVAGQIGHPTWLDYCLECRALVMERS